MCGGFRSGIDTASTLPKRPVNNVVPSGKATIGRYLDRIRQSLEFASTTAVLQSAYHHHGKSCMGVPGLTPDGKVATQCLCAGVWQLCRAVPVASKHWLALRSIGPGPSKSSNVAIANQTLPGSFCNQSPTTDSSVSDVYHSTPSTLMNVHC